MSLVDVHTEWDPLEEIVVGTMAGARVPVADRSLIATEYPDMDDPQQIPSGPFPGHVVEQTEAELEELVDLLTGLGVSVRRPGGRDHKSIVSTPDWSTDGFYDYCPRDGFLAVGNSHHRDANGAAVPVPRRVRLQGPVPGVFRERCAMAVGAQASADRRHVRANRAAGAAAANLEPAFDAANVLRFGTDLLYQVSDSGNMLGAHWLQSALGEQYTVHPCEGLYTSTHIDSTIVPLRPGLVLVNPARVNDDNMPAFLRAGTGSSARRWWTSASSVTTRGRRCGSG